MESGNGGASSKGVLVPVSERSDVFQSSIVAPLRSAYLYEESKLSFRYKSAFSVKNPALEEKYHAFREKRREVGYSEEDLKESYGFLLFDDFNKANALGETGVLTGNSTCTTLGDPLKGVYISMYSDCLDLNRWYHGKSGYIAIIRLTKGRVKKVLENYTQNFTTPTVGFDCHVSEQLPLVSSKTSSFLAFERTQYYMYELLDDGSNVTTQSPSAACPIAIVSFSYTDTKATLEAPEEKSEEKKLGCQYFSWKGQLQIGPQFYDVGLRYTAQALIPAVLPPVVKIDRAISMFNLRLLLPRAVFETCFSGEVFLDSLYFSLCELVSSEVAETHSLSLLLREIKEKDLALSYQLNDGGFLILLHSSYFLTYGDTWSSVTDGLQAMFVFPNSQVIQRDTKFREKKLAISSEILQVLPVLCYAEGEVEKTPLDPSEELCEVLVQHMQSYASLINPGLAVIPTREVSFFPDQYDVPDAHKHLYSSPDWTNRAWQSFMSYLSKPDSFQLPVSKASEILVAGQEERMEDLDDDVYICLSSPEEPPAMPDSMESEDQLTDQISPVNGETPVDSCITSAGSPVDLTVPRNVVPDDVQAGDATKDTGKSDLSVLIKTDEMGANNLLVPSQSNGLPAELIVSITSAEKTVTDESLSVISTMSATKHNDFQLSGFPTAKLHTEGVNSLNDESVTTKTVLHCPVVTKLTKTKRRKLRRGHPKNPKKLSKPFIGPTSLQIPAEDDKLKSPKENQAKESSDAPEFSHPSNIDRRKVKMRQCKFRNQPSQNETVSSASVGLVVPEEEKTDPGQQSLETTITMDFEACPMRKKTERWDLKPVISECGRILVPHGSVDFADQIKSLKDKLRCKKDEQCPEKMLVDTSVTANDSDEMVQESSPTPETAVGETEATTSNDGGNHLQHVVVVSDVNPEHNVLGSSEDGNGSLTLNSESSEHFSKTDGTATPPSEAVKENHTNTLSPGKNAKKGEFLLSKLKSVLLRGKRKTDILVSEKTTADTAQDTEPCLKKGKVDSHAGNLKSLTPKAKADKIQETECRDTRQEQTILEKQSQIIHRPPPIFSRRGRIKTLKKHQAISTEYVKKKWWLHFQTPACFASETLKNKECTRDNSVRKPVKEKMQSACSSTDALSLLADLALSASNEQVPPQPDPALERKTETSLKKGDLSKNLTSAEQESVLHSLLRQPAATTMQPLDSTSPNHLVEGSEWVGLVSKEHAYSLPPSSSLLLGLPGTPFQVSPLSGSSRLLRHHQTMYGNGIKTLQPSVGQENGSEQNNRSPEYLNKQMMRRRKFRHARTFVDKDGSIQVTKQWKENYDFSQDSKFTNDSKDRTVVRALHGPWDFSMQDTNEEVRLIVHMWIGLFYSRSTARFFHVDPYPHSEESYSFEMSSGMVPDQSELKAKSFGPFLSFTDTSISKAVDFSKKDDSMLDQWSEILDLSLRNSNAEIVSPDPQVNRKETSVSIVRKEPLNTLESSVGPQEEITIQRSKKVVPSAEIIHEVNDFRSALEKKRTCTPLQKAGSLEHTDVPSCKDDGTIILVKEEMEMVSVQPENNQTASGTSHVLFGCNNKKTAMKDGIENSEATETTLVQKHGRDSSESVKDEEVDSNREAGDVLHTVEHDETESKDGEKMEVKEKPYQEGNVEPSPQVIHTNEDPTRKELSIVCNGNVLENEKQLSEEEPKAVSPGNSENVNDDVDCRAMHKGKVTEDEDHIGKEDGPDEKDSCVSPMETDSDLSDSNREAGDVLHTVEHDETESKDGENWEMKENPYQEGNVEPPPQVIHTNEDPTQEELSKVCNGNVLENEKQLSEEEPKAVSPGNSENVNDDVDCCAMHESKVTEDEDHIAKEDGPDEKNSCVSPMETDSDLSDSNKETGDVLHTVEHVETESKDGENWEMKENPYQEGNVEPPPQVIHTNEDPTQEELSKVCNGNVLENEKQLSEEEPKAVSPGNSENVNDDVDSCAMHESKVTEDEDHIGKEDGLDAKDSCVSPMETDSDLIDQPVPMMSDCPDSVKVDCITESNPEPPLDEQPPQADNKEDACHDLQLKKLCADGSVLTDEHDISEKCPHAPSEMDPFSSEPAVEKHSENDTCLADEVHYQKSALPMSDENKCTDGPILQTNDSVEKGSQNKVMANFNRSSDDHEIRDTKSIKGEQDVDNTTEKEQFSHQTHSPQYEAEVELSKETDLKQIDKTKEALEKIHREVVIPFIGIDTSEEDTVQPHDSHSQGKVEEVVQGQEEIPFIGKSIYPETDQPTGVCSASQMDTRKADLSSGKLSLSLIDASDTNHPGSDWDDRCSTPTMDEKPFEDFNFSGSSSTSVSAFSGSETSKNMTQKRLSRGSTSIKDEMPQKSTVDANPQPDLHPDVELRTLRVLQSISTFLSKSSHSDTSSQIETPEMKPTLDQTTYPRSKNINTGFAQSHNSFDSKAKKISNTAPAVVLASTSQELYPESTGHFIISPFKSKLEEVLGVKLQLQKTDSSVHQRVFEKTKKIQETSAGKAYCQTYRSVPSTESLKAINPNFDQDTHKTTLQTNLSNEPRSYSQRPVMAVKPSKSDESQGDYSAKDGQIESAVASHFSKDKEAKNSKVTYTIPTTMLLVKNPEILRTTSEGVYDDQQEASGLSSRSSLSSYVSDSTSQDISKCNQISSSSISGMSFESAQSSSKLDDGNQGSVEKVGQTTKKSIQINQKDCTDASSSHADYNDTGILVDSLLLGPESSLICTVYNTSRKRSYSFLEQVSRRCIQDDLTEASMEQECLIFSENMKQLLKKSKTGPISQQDPHDELDLSCASPVTVHFCSLEEQDDSVDHLNTYLDTPSLVGQKIKVDLSERLDLIYSTEEENTLHLQNTSQGAGNPMEHAGVSGMTSECAQQYKAMMNDVCAVKKVPSRPKHFRMDRGYPNTEPGNHFDFCDQMKRELDKSFRSNLNSVVKKSCKTKYRFYILMTSDDPFFEETKAQLEAEGHTSVEPSQFFLGEDSSSSLLIILRNEDIAEHICEVQHLLKLKTSPDVQFAGIDEPDDVVNLTHQELFMRGGFIMFDSAALEPLSLGNMKQMFEILQELSRTGKWKWMMHYRDSRRLKENARLSAEAKEKKNFLNFCQESGILEVLPYHECDLMSRDLPDYLTCLVRLQVQNISARYPVFITDTTTDSAFGKNGILTMTFDSFLTYSPSKPFTA
ncbi:uncharacterized protein tasor2 isoform X2 [Anoplopoma fimbria]|uniref:uncharacterized protein tasor2 isoform X2 n=1 Tax=Anoplopoma fimbria TaxID=229290 RepID=UPI0023EAEA93|nr:uncharacterized protein tasor2 isoform X2 [Anoplopoma fimbria]